MAVKGTWDGGPADTLSETIAEVYADGLADGQSWSGPPRLTGTRDAAMKRADALEAANSRLREALNEIVAEGYDGDFAVETARNALGLPLNEKEA